MTTIPDPDKMGKKDEPLDKEKFRPISQEEVMPFIKRFYEIFNTDKSQLRQFYVNS